MTCALVPLNRLDLVKSRLGLKPSERKKVALEMVDRVLSVLCQTVERVVLVCPDPAAASLCKESRVEFLLQEGEGLNEALEQGRAQLGSADLMVVLADLPLLSATEVREFLSLDEPVALACDREGRGTNMLRLRDLPRFSFQFGPGSCRLHLEEARRLGVEARLFRSPGSEQDLDEPEHLELLTCR